MKILGLRVDHWTPRYVFDRALVAAHERRHPREPWWTRQAVHLLADLLRPTDRCFEWGSGRSTVWLAARTARVESVEHHAGWHGEVTQLLTGYPHAGVRLVADTVDEYVGAVDDAGELDVVVVDGLHRDRCALAALAHLVPGGILILDNAERHLPAATRPGSPQAIGDRHETELWAQFADEVVAWRRVWTSDGVTHTAVFLKP